MRHRAVPGRAPRSHPHAVYLLLAVRDSPQHPGTEEIDKSRATLVPHPLRVQVARHLRDEPAGALGAVRFLVGHRDEHHSPAESCALPDERVERQQVRHAHPLIVERAPAIDRAIRNLTAERRVGPPRGIGRDDVDVVADDEGLERGIAPLDACDDQPAARLRFQYAHVLRDAALAHDARQPRGGGHLVAVRGVELDVATQQFKCVGHGSLLLPQSTQDARLREVLTMAYFAPACASGLRAGNTTPTSGRTSRLAAAKIRNVMG